MKQPFEGELPAAIWREETFWTYDVMYLDNGSPNCELAEFGWDPHWTQDKEVRPQKRMKNARLS